MKGRNLLVGIVLPAAIVVAVTAAVLPRVMDRPDRDPALTLSGAELEAARNFSLAALQPEPEDPSNRVADLPAAVALGRELFFDTRLSANSAIACASCHRPGDQFQDGLPLALALGRNFRRTMPIAGSQGGPWFFWDGRKDSQWSQAL
ncbi:MAG: cytochrome-c peroxidase, partial [Pseudomonadota bacterium]|nr:cytochrome-c peroxidase [Pseudomonadota bacterium]